MDQTSQTHVPIHDAMAAAYASPAPAPKPGQAETIPRAMMVGGVLIAGVGIFLATRKQVSAGTD